MKFTDILDATSLQFLPENFREIGWKKYLKITGGVPKPYSESELVSWIVKQQFCLQALMWFLEYEP